MIDWIMTAQGLAATVAAIFASMLAWWNLGLPRLYLNGTRVAQMSDTQPIDLNSASLGIGRHASGHIDEFRIAHVQRSDGWIETTGTT